MFPYAVRLFLILWSMKKIRALKIAVHLKHCKSTIKKLGNRTNSQSDGTWSLTALHGSISIMTLALIKTLQSSFSKKRWGVTCTWTESLHDWKVLNIASTMFRSKISALWVLFFLKWHGPKCTQRSKKSAVYKTMDIKIIYTCDMKHYIFIILRFPYIKKESENQLKTIHRRKRKLLVFIFPEISQIHVKDFF